MNLNAFDRELDAIQDLSIAIRNLAYESNHDEEIAYIADQLDYLIPMIIRQDTKDFGMVLTHTAARFSSCRHAEYQYLSTAEPGPALVEGTREAA